MVYFLNSLYTRISLSIWLSEKSAIWDTNFSSEFLIQFAIKKAGINNLESNTWKGWNFAFYPGNDGKIPPHVGAGVSAGDGK